MVYGENKCFIKELVNPRNGGGIPSWEYGKEEDNGKMVMARHWCMHAKLYEAETGLKGLPIMKGMDMTNSRDVGVDGWGRVALLMREALIEHRWHKRH